MASERLCDLLHKAEGEHTGLYGGRAAHVGSAEADQEVTAQNRAGGETEEGDLSAAGVTEAKNSHDYRPAQRSQSLKPGTVPDEASVPKLLK